MDKRSEEERREAIAGMSELNNPRERFRRRDELDRAFGCGIYAGATEVVHRGGTPEEVVSALIEEVERRDGTVATGHGADCLGFRDGRVVHLCLQKEAA